MPLSGNPFTGINGYRPNGRPAEGSWQIRTLATPVLKASTSSAIGVPVVVQTWINHAAITTYNGHRHLTGVIDDQPAAGPLAGQQIRLSYRLPGSHRCHYLATTTTGPRRRFRFPITATGRWYRARYPGHSYYLPASGAPIYNHD